MYGNASKLVRVGVGAGHGNKRSSFPPSSSHRPSAPADRRMSFGNSGGPRSRTSTNSGAAARTEISSVEENFSLVPGKDPPAFAMIIRLTPDLVNEIIRVEAEGAAAKIKFDSNANNTAGNVIGVGDKDFRFTWSSEIGDLCDLYEERQSGQDRNGLLIESGSAWRKVNVQRILDESTTNHVKMRSEEAERKQKSRKAIILDPANPSMKNQMKAAAAETNPWRMPFKQKKEATFKKRNFEPYQVNAPPKTAIYKSGSSTSAAKGRQSASPLPSPPDQSVAPASPVGMGSINKSHATVEEIIQTPVITKEKKFSYEKEIPSRVLSTTRATPVSKDITEVAMVDLPSMLISLLKDNPKGMGLKALEKAIGDIIPNSVKDIEPIIKRIASLQLPGRYILKPGIELESFKKPLSRNAGYPEDNTHQEDYLDHILASEPATVEKIFTNEFHDDAQLNTQLKEESIMLDKIDIQQHSPDLLGENKVSSQNITGQAGSSSNSDSDSESNSSDSGTGSRSHRRSKSPVGSGSGSSSDSESDASSNSKEGSDVDVDIMSSDNEKEPMQKDGLPMQNEIGKRQDDHGFAVEIETILPNDQDAEISFHPEEMERPVEHTQSYTSIHDQERQKFIGSLFYEKENLVKDGFRHEHSDRSERVPNSNKSKRASDLKKVDEKSARSKRLKAGSLPQPPTLGSPDSYSNRLNDEMHKGSDAHMIDRRNVLDTAESYSLFGFNEENRKKYVSDFHQPGPAQRFVDHGGTTKVPDRLDKFGKHIESSGRGPKCSERSSHMPAGVTMQEDKGYRETQDEDAYANHKKVPKSFKESSFSGMRSLHSDTQYKKNNELVEKFKETGNISNLYMEPLLKDTDENGGGRSPAVNGRSKILQRELSALELGELREHTPEETAGMKKNFERKNSFKQSVGKARVEDTWNLDITKGRPAVKETLDPVKLSPPCTKLESVSKEMTPEHYVEDDKIGPQHRVAQSQHLFRADQTEVGSNSTKLANVNDKFRQDESESNQGTGMEGYKETNKKSWITELQPFDSKREPKSKKQSRPQPLITVGGLSNGQKEATFSENVAQKRRESSSDENSCSYSKYEKDEPELRGPIKDFSQYEEYVREYRDKYDSYCSLDKTLETDRNHFLNMGKNLEYSKGRDMDRYYNLLGELKDSYQQCGPRHKRLKSIFVVLHEELQTLKQRIKDYALWYIND